MLDAMTVRGLAARTKVKLHVAATEHMNVIATSPERVKAYFQDPFVKYAA